jgi:hypothetical protein
MQGGSHDVRVAPDDRPTRESPVTRRGLRAAEWLQRKWHGDEDSDPEEVYRHRKACLASVAAIVVGLPFGYLGAGRGRMAVSCF